MNPTFAKSVLEALAFDPLAEAEKLTGKSYKDDKTTESLGMAMHFRHVQDSNDLIAMAGDTPFSMDAIAYREFIERLGFHCVLELPFSSKYGAETLLIHWRDDGLLLRWDTFGGTSRNSASLYFNWQPNGEPEFPRNISGGFHDFDGVPFLCGSFDAREAFQSNLTALEAGGKFLPKWRKAPFLWLLHYQDSKAEGYDHNAINAERLAMLPPEVMGAIAGE